MKPLAAALVLVPLAAVAARPQTPAPPVFGSDINLVNVAVTVRDRQGKLVPDLGPEDFVLLDQGRPQKVSLFGRAHEPGHDEAMALDLGLLMDTSESMLPQLKLAQEAATRFLEAIPRARELYTVFFDEEIRVSRYDSEHQQGLFERILEAKGGGNTALYDAIAAYISRIEGGNGRKVVVLFTDGEDTRSSLTQGEALSVIRSSGAAFYPVAFTGSAQSGSARALKSRAFMQQLADMSGGAVYLPGASRDLAGVFRKILDELEAQYVIGFVPSLARSEDDRYRRITVKLKKPGLKVRHRAGYQAPLAAAADNTP
ncbi:MAG TPA: VWA domain-containing protein [Vicinamibacteria bacterium]